ncbi:hypothetical protein HDF14_004056 [Edaphobacter lichenicola]|uniref:ABC transporter substrate-binding protein n=1 Tax=Tunturiibacter gelidiferens TaxID=3069689 RepID=A0A9X0QH77_9BACT|nr:hypothetical protein [Edaphobacter lichenicola]
MRSTMIKTLLTFALFGAIAAAAETDLRVKWRVILWLRVTRYQPAIMNSL